MTTENATNGGSTDPLAKLSAAGVSIWLDDLSRERLETGNLAELIKQRHVVGVTTNPTIFASALANGERYDEQLRSLVSSGASVEDIITELTTDDVRNACDVFMDTFEATGGQDGRVSIEVEPGLAFDTDGTLAAARMLYKKVDRPNLLIKIPATTASLPAITATIADGISVNVTLIFGLDRYGEVMNAYLEGLEKAKENGEDLSKIHSVASFFVSRVDSEIDKQLEGIGTEKALSLRGKAGIANARLAFERYEDVFCDRERWKALKAAGANPQRPLWASTGVKNPDYSDTMYVTELVARGIVNTMPEKTLQAVADHGEIAGDTIHEHYHGARHVMSDLEMLGIDYDGVIATLEQEGVDKFVKSWGELVETVEGQVEGARSGDQG